MKKFDVTCSIVLYKNDRSVLLGAIDSFLSSNLNLKLYLIDNSPEDSLRSLKQDERVEYIFTGANLGFGKAHNIALRKAVQESRYHLVLNPDVYFTTGVLETLVDHLEKNPDVAQIMPKILYPDGKIQRLCKLLPTPVDLFLRRFFPWFPGAEEMNRRYELVDSGYDKIMNIPYLSGCFMLLRTSALEKVGFFDERIFMYIEDTDLTRRLHGHFKTLFYPGVSVYHHYNKGSYKNFKLMLYNLHGAIIYFSKWGWVFDQERVAINRRVIAEYLRG
jgi:GT2 family glycosyltransferase